MWADFLPYLLEAFFSARAYLFLDHVSCLQGHRSHTVFSQSILCRTRSSNSVGKPADENDEQKTAQNFLMESAHTRLSSALATGDSTSFQMTLHTKVISWSSGDANAAGNKKSKLSRKDSGRKRKRLLV